MKTLPPFHPSCTCAASRAGARFFGTAHRKDGWSEQRVKRSDLLALRPRLAVHGRPARCRPADSTGVRSSADTHMGHPPSRRGAPPSATWDPHRDRPRSRLRDRAPWYIAVASGITTTVLVAIGFRWKTTPRSATCLTSASIKTAKPTAIKVPRHQLVEIDVANGAQTHPVRAVRYKEHNRPRQRGRATGGPD